MLFEARQVKPYGEPVSPTDLEIGATYFMVQFVDDDMLIPTLEPVVFIGRDLMPDDQDTLYFQDAASYRGGIRFGSVETDSAVLYRQKSNEINHIFEYERALDLLLGCSLRRRGAHRAT